MIQAPHPNWHSRGYLPHFDYPGLLQMITYHLADSLPASALARLRKGLENMPKEARPLEQRKRIESWIDDGYGSCVLKKPKISGMIIENWQHHAGLRYDLIAWTVMPNHIHVLIRVYEGQSLARIVQGWKGYSGKKIREMTTGVQRTQYAEQTLGVPRKETMPVWHREYWDRFIRDEKHFTNVIRYIENNPVKAGLVGKATDWPWSSTLTNGQP
ncbi:REP-associated tyrosine transposase [Desulfoplanes sp. PS50]